MMQGMRIINTNTLTMGSTGICETFIPNSLYTQCIRWKRKPIWLPTAKSKIFRVPVRSVLPAEDVAELRRLHNNYKTYMNSFRSYIYQLAKASEMQSKMEILQQTEEEDFQLCKVINDKWNAEVAKVRDARLAQKREARKEIILQNILKKETQQEKLRKQTDEIIKKAKIDASTFITAENVDAAIEECLANVVNHNRSLDLEGNWHEGTLPATSTVEKMMKPTIVE